MAEEILRTFVLRCKEGRLEEEEAVALLDPALIHVEVEWQYEGGGFTSVYSLGLMLVNVVRHYQHVLPHWESIVTALVRTGLDVNEVEDGLRGFTLLHHCAADALDGDADFARVLVHALGCKSNIRNRGGWTPLLLAALENTRSNVLEILLTAPDMDLTTQTNTGQTALDIAKSSKADVCAGLLQAAEVKKEKEAQSARDDTEDRRKLNAAIADAMRRGGIAKVLFLHIAILGAARTGKSSLLKSLLDEQFDEAQLSTIGMHIRSAMSRISSDGQWMVLDDITEALERLFATTLIKVQSTPQSSASGSSATQRRPPPSGTVVSTQTPAAAAAAEASSAAPNMDEEPPAEGIAEVLRCLLSKDMAELIKGEVLEQDFAIVNTWDLGGQQVYQCVQPLFIAENTTYVVTYDASLDLEAKLVMPEVLTKKNRIINRATCSRENPQLFDDLLLY